MKILVFDDDLTFCKVIARCAAKSNLEMVVCNTMEDFCMKAFGGDFDFAMIDYHLESYIGNDVAKAIRNKPVVIMSAEATVGAKQSNWPQSVKGFVTKRDNAADTIHAAIQLAWPKAG